jgi:TetR/AcrR family transcriptional regulator, cholesterol catabolism regulator
MERTRARILDAAVQLFSEVGYIEATTADIAERAGVTKRTLYRHMRSKERMLAELHRDFLDEGLRRLEVVLARGNQPADTFRNLIEEHLNVVADFRPSVRIFYESMKYLSAADRADVQAQRDAYQRAVVDLLGRGQASGAFRTGDAVVRSMLVLGALNSGYEWFEPSARTADDQPLGSFVAELLSVGLTGPHDPVGELSGPKVERS